MYRGLIAVDLDGTLLQPDFVIADKDREALKKAHESGYLIAICTGRSAHLIKRKVVDWDIKDFINVIIGCNGTEYYDCNDRDEVEILGNITKAGVLEVFDIIADIKESYGFTWYSDTDVYTYGDNPRVERLRTQMQLPVTFVTKEELIEIFPEKWPKAVFFFEDPDLKYKLKELIDNKKQEAYDMVFSHELILEMIPSNINKGTALKEIARRNNIPTKDIMAIGDQENDRQMLENSGFAVAMGNAIEALKEIADYISGDLKDNGFAQAVEVFISKRQI